MAISLQDYKTRLSGTMTAKPPTSKKRVSLMEYAQKVTGKPPATIAMPPTTAKPSGATQSWNGMEIPANIPTKNLIAYDPKTGNATFKIPDFLGGGAYTQDKNRQLVKKTSKEGHTTYGGVKEEMGMNRDDIIPVSQGGENTRPENIRLVPKTLNQRFAKEVETPASGTASKENIVNILRKKEEITNEKSFWQKVGSAIGDVGTGLKQAGKYALELTKGMFYDPYKHPSDMVKEAEKGVPNVPVLKQTGQAVLRTLIPLGEGFGTIIGEDIIHQRELSKQAITTKPPVVGKEVLPTTQSGQLITHKLTAKDVIDVAEASIPVGLMIAGLLKGPTTKATLKISDALMKESKVPITYSDMQKITSSGSAQEAISRVGIEKYNAYQDASRSNSVRQALRDGYVTLAEKEPTTFSTILRNAATNPITDVANIAKAGEKPSSSITPEVQKALPERLTQAEAQDLIPAELERYVPAIEEGQPIFLLKQLPEPAGLLESPKTQYKTGEGFEMTDKPDKAKLQQSKLLQESAFRYKTAIQTYNQKPTPTRLKAVLKARADFENARTPVGTPFAHELNPQSRPFAHELQPVKPTQTAKTASKPVVSTKAIETPQSTSKIEVKEAPIKETAKPVEQKPIPVTEGNKISGVAKSINAKAIEQGLSARGFDQLAEFKGTTFKEQAQKVADLDMEKARAIVRGEEAIPSDIRSAALISAMEDLAKATKDTKLMYELANSPLATKVSESASELSVTRMREKDSATMKLQEIKKAREARAEKRVSTETRKAAKTAKTETEKVNLSKEDLEWDKFLKEIEC